MWKTIRYSANGNALLDVNEQGMFYSYKTKGIKCLKQMKRQSHNYYYWTENNKNYYAHREVAKAFPEICGEWFDGCEVHHKDGNPLNNEANNLIVCTKEQHILFHRQLSLEKAKKKERKEIFSKKLNEFKKNGQFSIKYYCRKTKVNPKDGQAPVEMGIYQNGERHFKNTGLRMNPDLFKKKKYTKEVLVFMQSFNN